MRRSSRARNQAERSDAYFIETSIGTRRSTRAQQKNPLNSSKIDANTEFVTCKREIEETGHAQNYSDGEEEVTKALKKEKETVAAKPKPEPKKIEILDDAKLNDMRMLFGMSEEEIKAIVDKQNVMLEEIKKEQEKEKEEQLKAEHAASVDIVEVKEVIQIKEDPVQVSQIEIKIEDTVMVEQFAAEEI